MLYYMTELRNWNRTAARNVFNKEPVSQGAGRHYWKGRRAAVARSGVSALNK